MVLSIERRSRRCGAVLALACAGVLGGWARADEPAGLDLTSLRDVRVVRPANSSISAYPINSPPINGWIPQVVFGMTMEQDKLDFSAPAKPSSYPTFVMPNSGSPYYTVATFDTGAQSHIITYLDSYGDDFDPTRPSFDFWGNNRAGSSSVEIVGANGSEFADVSDAMGIYATGLAGATVSGGRITSASPLQGQWNVSVLTADPDSALPNIVGAPMAAQYRVNISNTETRRLTVGPITYRSPQLTFGTLDSNPNSGPISGYMRLSLTLQPGGTFTQTPSYFPSFQDINNLADDPMLPTFWGSLFANVNVTHSGGTASAQPFMFDTGAQVTVLSVDTAASIGFYATSTPDFYVEVAGVGGTTVQVPGFYMSQLSLTTRDGPLTWTNVPVIVMNLPDPRGQTAFLPGILGTNLFSDRDLILNASLANPYVAIGNVLTPKWNATAGGSWGEDLKWILGVPDGPDMPANFLTSASPQSIVVDGNYTAGSIKFDNTASYTLSGSGTITLATTTGPASITALNANHVISAPVHFANDATINVGPQSGQTLSLSGALSGSIALTKSGLGPLVINGPQSWENGASFTAAGGGTDFNTDAGSAAAANLAMTVNSGAVVRLGSTQHLKSLDVGGSANMLANGNRTLYTAGLSIASGGKLDLNDNDLVVSYTGPSVFTTIQDYVFTGYSGTVDPGKTGIISSTGQSAGNTILALVDNALIGAGDWPLGSGNTVPSTAVLGKYTYFGDANLDGQVSSDDYALLDSNLGGAVVPGIAWIMGDANLDGQVTPDDYGILDSTLGQGLGQPLGPAGAVPVPEPSAILGVGMGVGMLGLGRRRRAGAL